jgi:hypothetical protein
VSQNSPVVEVVDISRVRLVANVVERDLRQLQTGDPTEVEVDAFPGESFMGRIARVSPVLDPATRTAPIEIEIPNPTYRLKPGMYARVQITIGMKKDALVVPTDAMADLGGRRGVFQVSNNSAIFKTVQTGTEQGGLVEILSGLTEGEEVITTGARALRDGDPVIVDGRGRGRGAPGGAPADGPSTTGSAPAGERGGFAASRQGGPETAAPAAPNGGEGRRGFSGGEGRRFGGDGAGRLSGEGRQGRRSGSEQPN